MEAPPDFRHQLLADIPRLQRFGSGAGLAWRSEQHDETPLAASTVGRPQRAAIAHSVYVPEVRHPVEVSIASLGAAEAVPKLRRCFREISG